MTTRTLRRPARRSGPDLPEGEIQLQEPPALPEVQPQGFRAVTVVLPSMLMSGAMLLMFTRGGAGVAGGSSLVLIGLMGTGMVVMLVGTLLTSGGDRKYRVTGSRRDYLRYLSQTRRQVRLMAEQQRGALAWLHPDPGSLWSLAMTSRLWERRPSHPDFGELRVGTGAQQLAVRLVPPQSRPLDDLEPMSAKALRRFIRAYSVVPDLPVALYLRGFAQIRLTGDVDAARDVLRAMIAQLVTFHGPDEVQVAFCVAEERLPDWDWVKWLPHAQHGEERDAAGGVRLVRSSLEDLEALLGNDFRGRQRFEPGAEPSRGEPFVVIVLDGGSLGSRPRLLESGYRNAVLLEVADRPAKGPAALTLDISADEVQRITRDRFGKEVRTPLARPDRLSMEGARSLARLMAGTAVGASMARSEATAHTVGDTELPALLGIHDLERLDAHQLWADRSASARLRVPIGVDVDGRSIELDLKESAEGGMGPHGLLIGATGSGKSELLRTLVLALATTHSSETLNFVLVDFKGGATFAGLETLPHVSALITNLAGEAGLVERMRDALRGELVRRQEVLRAAGGFASLRDYEAARAEGAALEPMPTLFLVVDEFSELIATHPDFIELFVMVGRLGRSLGVHLLLASQRLDDGRIHQLESHLSYRIGLRTFSAMESRAVIGIPDAYELPSAPGNGYLRSDVSTIHRFKAAYVSAPYRLRSVRVQQEVLQTQVVPFGTEPAPVRSPVPSDDPAEAPSGDPTDEQPQPVAGSRKAPSVISVIVSRLVDQGPPAHQIWLPPLSESPTLDQVLPPIVPDDVRGFGVPGAAGLSVPLGIVDRPFEQVRDLLTVDLSGVGGHVGIAGGPQSGKSTMLATLVAAVALSCTPAEAQFYCLDFGGGLLSALVDLPHVGGVAGRHDPERVNRTVSEVTALMSQREHVFAEHAVAGMAALRSLRGSGGLRGIGLEPHQGADIFLVVDGWSTLRQDFEEAEARLRELATNGLNYGVHLVLTASRWSEMHHAMRDKIGTRLELRLGDPVESVIDLRAAATVPSAPGRGLTPEKLHFLAALPRLDGDSSGDDVQEGLRDLVSSVAEYWTGPRAAGVRTLPSILPADDLPPATGELAIALGVDEAALAPVWHDFRTLPHLTCLGDNESGKTNLLRLTARAIRQRLGPEQARILAVDYRRQLFDDVPDELRLGYAVSVDSTRQAVAEAVAGLSTRVPGPEVSPDQLRRRDWWTGPLLFVLVDDYDLIAGPDNPLLPLLPLLPQAADIGLHVVLTRAAAGAMRLSMDPVLRRLQELNTPDVVLSCPPSEGPLLGGIKPRQLPAGRALLCTRRGGRLVQTARVPALEPADATSAPAPSTIARTAGRA